MWGVKMADAGDAGDAGDDAAEQHLYSKFNHIYFNSPITMTSAFKLNQLLRTTADEIKLIAFQTRAPILPIHLHITTYGGYIAAAWSTVDCIVNLGVPVYSVVDGIVASAGTLISLSCQKRFMRLNAYMMVHELSSSISGRMSEIQCETENLKNLMEHLRKFYMNKTKLTSVDLDGILTKDVYWNAEDCIQYGIVDEIYTQ